LVEGEWRWIDATPGIWQDPDVFPAPVQTVPFTNWAADEPNDHFAEADYAKFGWYGDRWSDRRVTARGPYLIEYEPLPACANGADDDGDGLVDLADPGCPVPEASPEDPLCDNDVDDDGDGLVDFDDPTCHPVWPYWESSPCGVGFELAALLPLVMRRWRRLRAAAS
jgi:hypothetical protein